MQKSTAAPTASEVSVKAIQPLTQFQQAFLSSGIVAEVPSRAGNLLWPRVNGRDYQMVIADCECADLVVYYLPDPDRRAGYFYAACPTHGFQTLGRAVRGSRNYRGHFGARKSRGGWRR